MKVIVAKGATPSEPLSRGDHFSFYHDVFTLKSVVSSSTTATQRQRQLLLLGSWGREILRVKVNMERYSGKRRKRRDERGRQWKFLK